MFEERSERLQEFKQLMGKVFSGPQCEWMADKLAELNFFDAPASAKHHGAHAGGLFDHSAEVTRQLLLLTEKLGLQWEREKSPYIVGMFHDLCKCDQYERREDGSFGHLQSLLNGHGDKSVILAQGILELTREEILCIRWHMGAFDDQKNWNSYGAAVEAYPTVLFTHTADMLASRVAGV